MRELDAKIISEIEDLVKIGQRLQLALSGLNAALASEDVKVFSSWITRLGQLIRRLYGKTSQFFVSYTNMPVGLSPREKVARFAGIAEAIEHDVSKGLLFNVKSLAQAEVFADFLEMGEHLLKEGYKDAAAVIIGGVLEDSLRKLCDRNEIATRNESGKSLTIDPLNIALAKAEVYSKLDQKQITTWADVRNNAAHGKYDQYSKEEVKMMFLFVQDFTGKHLA